VGRLPSSFWGTLVCLSLAAACFADLSGFSDGADARVLPDGAAPDALAPPPPPPPVTPPPNGSCVASKTIDAPFTSDFGGLVPISENVSGYPHIGTLGGSSAAVLFPVPDAGLEPIDAGPDVDGGFQSVTQEILDAHSGLWTSSPVPLVAFDVTVDLHVDCATNDSCADGVMIAWLDLASTSKLSNTNHGSSCGLPDRVAGAAVVLDNLANGETSDPPPPSIQLIALDATKEVATYPWVVSFAHKPFAGAWHTVAVSLRNGMVTVKFDGAAIVTGKAPSIASGLFGLTAGTGADSDVVGARNLHAAFYSCTP
jgi:hypothetical protein